MPMSRRANPVTVGIFMIGAVLLLIVGLVVFGSSGLFDDRATFVSYFEESANGLEVGADVKFKGVPVGRVKDLAIRVDMGDKSFQVPVTYEIDLSQVKTEGGRVVDLSDPDVLRQKIGEGLRAQLKLESIVTGLLYVELTFDDELAPPVTPPRNADYPIIPATSSFLASMTDQASELFADVQEIDVGQLNENIMLLLLRANQKLDAIDAASINRSLLETSQAFGDLARSPEIRQAMQQFPVMAERFNATMDEMNLLIGRFGVVVDSLRPQLATANEELVLTLQATRAAVTETQGMFSSDYGVGYQMEEALASMSEMADALELLLVQLEQNPGMLIRGRVPEED